MDNVTYNDLCVKLWRVPFVVLVFIAFVFVSGSWGACRSYTTNAGMISQYCGSGGSGSCESCASFSECADEASFAEACRLRAPVSGVSKYVGQNSQSACVKEGLNCSYNQHIHVDCVVCPDQCSADSIACSRNPEATWNSDNCTCDTLTPPDTTYRCQNTTIGSATDGVRPIAVIYRCISTGSSSDQCVQTNTLNGTCDDWNFCEKGASDCEIPPEPDNRNPCRRSGGSTTSSKYCYYQCADGSSRACTPSSTEYVAGALWVGTCPEKPSDQCDPPLYSSADGGGSSSSVAPPASSSSAVPPDTLDNGDIDYTEILNAIRDTLHRANRQRADIESWSTSLLPNVENIADWTLNNWQTSEGINSKLKTFQEQGFNLASDTKKDLDSARLLLDEINDFLRNDTLNYPVDTSLNPVVRDIRDILLDSTLSTSDSLKNAALADAFKPYMPDSGFFRLDGLGGKLFETLFQNFSRDSAKASLCDRYYACLRSGGGPGACASIDPDMACTSGGTPMDGVANISMSILETLWDGIFGDDSTAPPGVAPVDSSVDVSPVYSSAVADMSEAIDSALSPNLKNIIDDIKNKADSLKNARPDSVKVSPDSLWRDSSEFAQYVDHILLPSGTGTDCFICQANLGDFNGLTDTTLSIYIDFSNFGGYNWCEIIRAVVKIATLVTCISLTLGSWAAAFGYNPKNDA